MHGGAPGSGGPKGARNGNYKHGRYTAEAIASRRWVSEKIRAARIGERAFEQLCKMHGGRPGAGDTSRTAFWHGWHVGGGTCQAMS
jgi:hypothetical protein